MLTGLSLTEELLRLAIEIEENGWNFYNTLAKQTKKDEIGDKFIYLAAQEKQHEITFNDMLGRLKGSSVTRLIAQYEYIKSLAESIVFGEDKIKTFLNNKVRTDVEVMEIGINMEKDSILFYSEIRGMLPVGERPVVDSIVSEEQKHLSELLYINRQLTNG